MPFDATPLPTLDPSVRDLPPRERLERLRDWLANGGPGKAAWDYSYEMNDCGTVGCALGWYESLTKHTGNCYSEFGISFGQTSTIFFRTSSTVGKIMEDVTPQDVATVIDMVIDGKIE